MFGSIFVIGHVVVGRAAATAFAIALRSPNVIQIADSRIAALRARRAQKTATLFTATVALLTHFPNGLELIIERELFVGFDCSFGKEANTQLAIDCPLAYYTNRIHRSNLLCLAATF